MTSRCSFFFFLERLKMSAKRGVMIWFYFRRGCFSEISGSNPKERDEWNIDVCSGNTGYGGSCDLQVPSSHQKKQQKLAGQYAATKRLNYEGWVERKPAEIGPSFFFPFSFFLFPFYLSLPVVVKDSGVVNAAGVCDR